MDAGFTVFNDKNLIQVDSTFVNQVAGAVINAPYSPYGNFLNVPAGIDVTAEAPALWVRSTGWVGGVEIRHGANGTGAYIVYYSDTAVQFCFASTQIVPADQGFGLQVFNAASKQVYNSAFPYPRIIAMPTFSGNVIQQNVAVPNNVVGTWWCANVMPWSLSVPMGGGSSTSYPPWILCGKLSGTTMQYKMVDSGAIIYAPEGDPRLNPYYGGTFGVPVALIPGT